MILKEGRQKWVNAGSVKGLFAAAPPPNPLTEPPLVEATPLPQSGAEPFGTFAFSTTPGAAYARRPLSGNHLLLIGGGAALAVVALATVIVLVLNRGTGQQTTDGNIPVNPDGDNKEVAAKKQLDLSYIAADFNAAVILHPERILERPFIAKLIEDKMLADFIKETGADPRKIERAIVLIDPMPGGNVAFLPAFIVQFAEPVDGAALVAKALEGAEKTTFEGKEYYRGKNRTAAKLRDCACVADDRTILAGPEPTLQKMLIAKDAQSPLRDRLPKVDLKHDLVVAFVMDQAERKDKTLPTVRQALGEILKQNKDTIPPNFEGVDKLGEQLAAVTLALDLGGDDLLSIELEATDDKAAEALHGLAKNGYDTLKFLVPSAKKEINGGLPKEIAEPTSGLVDELVKGLTVQKDGKHVQVSLKMPTQLPTVVDKLTPMLKELAKKPPASKPPTKKPTTSKEKSAPKDGSKK
jgi:hypothetical protein